jgi:hypothetical protein
LISLDLYVSLSLSCLLILLRIRNALERKKQKELEDQKVFEFNEEKYLKRKQQLATEGCKPFR